jgi:CheY-like chemotaxis protein
VGLFAAKAEKSGIELIFGFDPNLPQVVVGDLIRIKQVLNNLIHNALKFTQHGYIWVQIKGLDINEESVALEISVQDTGIGIPKDKQASIFEYFTQADTSTTRKFGGTGLGLSICTLLSKLMGGTIKLDSCPEVGSTFKVMITLPVGDSAVSVERPSSACLVTQKVLILDDNSIALNLFSTYLSFHAINHQTFQESNAAFAAIKTAQAANEPFDIVIVDHSLPEITGDEFKDQVLSHRHLRNTKMILLAPMGVINQSECDCHGFCACIPKPVSMSDFLMFLEMVASPGNRTMVTMDMLHRKVSKKELMENAVRNTDLKILLVEDNMINQVAAKEILKKIGFSTIEIVGNGQEAFDLVKRKAFDLVFMDIQMPIMDGLEATRRIRDWEMLEAGSKNHIPIIAMTANAIDGDRDECLEAGMDDYISKPFRKELFIDLLKKWVVKIKSFSGPVLEDDVIAASKLDNSVLVFNYSDTLDRYTGDLDILKLIVDMFIQQTPEMIVEIKEHILQNRIPEIVAVAHSLKGAAANVGADRIVELAKDMEKTTTSTTTGEANQFLLGLENEFAEFQNEFKSFNNNLN